MATAPIFTATPRSSSILVNTANTDPTGAAGNTRANVITAGANGTRVDSVQIKGIVAAGTTQAADTVRLWLNFGGATTAYLIKEVAIGAGSGNISASVQNADQTVALGIDLPNGCILQASTHVGGATASYHVTAFGGDY